MRSISEFAYSRSLALICGRLTDEAYDNLDENDRYEYTTLMDPLDTTILFIGSLKR